MADAIEQGDKEMSLMDIARDMNREQASYNHWRGSIDWVRRMSKDRLAADGINPDLDSLRESTRIGENGITSLMALSNGYSAAGGFCSMAADERNLQALSYIRAAVRGGPEQNYSRYLDSRTEEENRRIVEKVSRVARRSGAASILLEGGGGYPEGRLTEIAILVGVTLCNTDHWYGGATSYREMLFSSGPSDIVDYIRDRLAQDSSLLEEERGPGRLAECQKLIQGSTGINAQDDNGMTALHHAARNPYSGAIPRELINSGSEIDAQDADGKTALYYLVASAKARPTPLTESTMQALLDKHADVNIADKYGNTPLHLAVAAGDDEMIKTLIAAGANVNAVNKEGKTPMHKGAENNISGEGINLLLAAKADPNIQDGEGNVALHYLAEHAYDGTRHWGSLAEAGANIHIKNKAGVSCHDAIVAHRQAARAAREADARVQQTISHLAPER